MCAAIGRADLAPHGLATGSKGREVKAELAALLASQPMEHWEPIVAAADCCVTPILRVDEVLQHPQVRARGMVVELGGVKQYAPPLKLSSWPWAASEPAPAAGADSETVLAAAGFSTAEISALKASRVI